MEERHYEGLREHERELQEHMLMENEKGKEQSGVATIEELKESIKHAIKYLKQIKKLTLDQYTVTVEFLFCILP